MELTDKITHVSLQRLSATDKNSLADLANNKKIWNNLRDYFPHPYSTEDAMDFIGLTAKEDPPATFGIYFHGALAGVIGLVRKTDVYRKTAEIGYWVGEPFWNKGIAAAAVRLMVNYGFDKLKLLRIEAGIFEYNIASQRVLEKCGFEFEGVFKNSIIKNDQVVHEFRYGIIQKI